MNTYRTSLRKLRFFAIFGVTICAFFIACSGGSSGRDSHTALGGSHGANFNCDGSCPNEQLSAAQVETILRQAVAGAQAIGVSANIAVVDRVGNVLALYGMNGAPSTTRIDGQIGATGGLEGVDVPSAIAAISKAGTGAYLSSQGNAFSSRSASQIIQEHFDPGENQAPGGPLFGVQFSSLICGDVTVLNPTLAGGIPFGSKPAAAGLVGPRALPLGLSADPGGFPLYVQGDLVGGIGVEFDGSYSLDREIGNFENNLEEIVALSGARGFEAPSERTANNNFVAGKTLRYSDVGEENLPELPESLPGLENGQLLSVSFYSNGSIISGAVFGTPPSGYVNTTRAGVPATVLVDGGGNVRFPSRDGATLPSGNQLRAAEVEAVLDSAIVTATRMRAAIRRPLDTPARVSIWIVDTNGSPIGFTRGLDAPVFGTDVALQKARTAAFFSSPHAGALLTVARSGNGIGSFEDYVGAVTTFVGISLFDGSFALSNRGIGNLARPFYPDGIDGNPHGPLSLPFPGFGTGRTWSPFNDGLQLDLVFQRFVQPLGIPMSPPSRIPDTCVNERLGNALRNGMQIFAGAVPLYRGGELIGGIGISGDGIDQDDMIAFYGASRRGLDFVGHTGVGDPVLGFNAPLDIRADVIEPAAVGGTRLRYVNCPEAPFIGSNEQNQCDGL